MPGRSGSSRSIFRRMTGWASSSPRYWGYPRPTVRSIASASRPKGQGSDGHVIEAPAVVLNGLMEITRPAGSIGIPGLYVTDDPGAKEKAAQQGMLSLRFGLGWAKSHSLHTGQTPVLKYNRQLMQAILWGRLPIGKIVNVKVISLDRAPEGYRNFDAGVPNKFVIDPHGLVPKTV